MINSLKKIYALLPSKDRFKFYLIFLMMLFASFLELLGIGVVPAFIVSIADSDQILKSPHLEQFFVWIGIKTSESLIIFSSITLIGVYAFKNFYLTYYNYVKVKFITNREITLQNRIFKAYITAPYTFYIKRNSAELLRNVTSEVGKLVNGTIVPFFEISLKLIMFIFIVGTLLIIEPLITVATVIILGGGGYLFLKITQKKTNKAGREDRNARAKKNKVVLQGLGGFKDSRVLNRENMFLQKYDFYAKICRNSSVYKTVVKSLPKPIIETLLVMGILTITLIMVAEGRSFSAIIPILTLFGVSAIKLMPIFNNVIKEVTSIRYNASSVDAIYDDIKYLEKENKDFRDAILNDADINRIRRVIKLESISYQYPNSTEQVVDDVSLTIPKGKAVAFVGASGAGKTTIVDLILGLLTPTSGRITVDGIDINQNLRGWMKNIGYIPQSIYLLDDRIDRNIAFGIPDDLIDPVKLQSAISAAQLEELIQRLPHGVKTKVGERGVRLSGGQQQRIGIARALYNNPQVLVMDEATSALDNITERFVIDAIEQLKGDRTVIMIAHRLTTVKECDRIYMMDEGKVVAQGTYEELLERSEHFRKMSLMSE